MNKTAKLEVESSLNYLIKRIFLAFSLFSFLIVLSSTVESFDWTADLTCYDTADDEGLSIGCEWAICPTMTESGRFTLLRSIANQNENVQIASPSYSSLYHTDSTIIIGKNYDYTITCFNGTAYADNHFDNLFQDVNASDDKEPKKPTIDGVTDTPNDHGGSITITWDASATESEGFGDNYIVGYYLESNCTDANANISESIPIGTYLYEHVYDPDGRPKRTGNCVYRMAAYDMGLAGDTERNSTWTDWTGDLDLKEGVNGTDNIPPQPPTAATAADIPDDNGSLGIKIEWEGSIDEINIEGGVTDVLGYYIMAATAESDMNWTNIVNGTPIPPNYWTATGGPYYIAFNNETDSLLLGSIEKPWLISSYYDTTLFYFYITAYDGTFNSTGTSIMSAAFNAKPEIANDTIYLDPEKYYAQTEDTIYCTAFVCDRNNDEITSKYSFTVAAFAGGDNYEETDKDATCINLGPISPDNPIPQYPNLTNIYCKPGIEEYPDLWECTAALTNDKTFKGSKITCSQTPNDGKEDGDPVSSGVGVSQHYAINNTAPTASNVQISPAIPLGNETLICEYTYSDVDLDAESNDSSLGITTTSFKWFIQNEGFTDNEFVEIPMETGRTLNDYFDQNDKVMCSVNVCDDDQSWVSNPLCSDERSWFNTTTEDGIDEWVWLNGTAYYNYVNSTSTIIGGNSIPQLVEYNDDSNEINPTDVGNEVTFSARWEDVDPNEIAKIMVCDKAGGAEDYACNATNCPDEMEFGTHGNYSWIYTNQTGMMIDWIEIKIKGSKVNGSYKNSTGDTTPFIFSVIAYESDNITQHVPPTSSVPDYFDPQEMKIARSDWNSFTVGKWVKFTMQYNAQPLPDKYTALKLCVADPEEDGIVGSDLGGVGYAVRYLGEGENWFTSMINWVGKLFRSVFGITGYAATSYVNNCLEGSYTFSPVWGDSKVYISAKKGTPGIAWDDDWYEYVDIRINYKSTGVNGSCPGTKTYCETEHSPDKDQSCSYAPTEEDNTSVNYNIRACDSENACSIWREGNFSVNHAARLDWVTIGTNHLGLLNSLSLGNTNDVNDDWNLQCIQGPASDKDLNENLTSDIIIDADGWATPFSDIRNERDSNLKNNETTLTSCGADSYLQYIDVNDDGDYDYNIDTIVYDDGVTIRSILQFSNESSGSSSVFTVNASYGSGTTVSDGDADIGWELESFDSNERHSGTSPYTDSSQNIYREGATGQAGILDPTDTLLKDNGGAPSVSTYATITGSTFGPFTTEDMRLDIEYTVNGVEETCSLNPLPHNQTPATMIGTNYEPFEILYDDAVMNVTYTVDGIIENCTTTLSYGVPVNITGNESGPFFTENNNTLGIGYTINGVSHSCSAELTETLTKATLKGTDNGGCGSSDKFCTNNDYNLSLNYTIGVNSLEYCSFDLTKNLSIEVTGNETGKGIMPANNFIFNGAKQLDITTEEGTCSVTFDNKYPNTITGCFNNAAWEESNGIVYAQGFLWVGSKDDGLYQVDPDDGTLLATWNEIYGLSSNNIQDLKLDGEVLWISTWGGGIDKFNITHAIYTPLSGTPFINNYNTTKFDYYVWVANREGSESISTNQVSLYDPRTLTSLINLTVGNGVLGGGFCLNTSAIGMDSNRDIWVSCSARTADDDGNQNSTVYRIPFDSSCTIGTSECYTGTQDWYDLKSEIPYLTDLDIDADDNIWISTGGADKLIMLNASDDYSQTEYTGGLDYTYEMDIDSLGNIWVAEYHDNTVSRLTKSLGYAITAYAVGLNPTDVRIDNSGNIWIANFGANPSSVTLLNLSYGTAPSTHAVTNSGQDGVRAITFDSQNNLWSAMANTDHLSLVLANESYDQYTGTTSHVLNFGDYTVGLETDSTDRIWAINYKQNTTRIFKINISDSGHSPWTFTTDVNISTGNVPADIFIDGGYGGLVDNRLFGIEVGDGGILWIGTYHDGLIKFDTINEKVLATYTLANGDIYSNTNNIYTLAIDDQDSNILWLGGDNGLEKFDIIAEKVIDVFGSPEVSSIVPQGDYVYISIKNNGSAPGVQKIRKTDGYITATAEIAPKNSSVIFIDTLDTSSTEDDILWIGNYENGDIERINISDWSSFTGFINTSIWGRGNNFMKEGNSLFLSDHDITGNLNTCDIKKFEPGLTTAEVVTTINNQCDKVTASASSNNIKLTANGEKDTYIETAGNARSILGLNSAGYTNNTVDEGLTADQVVNEIFNAKCNVTAINEGGFINLTTTNGGYHSNITVSGNSTGTLFLSTALFVGTDSGIDITTLKADISAVCSGLLVTSTFGNLTLATDGAGADEYIVIIDGPAEELGFLEGVTYGGNDQISIATIVGNLSAAYCNLSVTSTSDGRINLTTTDEGINEHIYVTGGSASKIGLPIGAGNKVYGTDSISMINITNKINDVCDVVATDSSGYLKLTTIGYGADEYINVSQNAHSTTFGFTTNGTGINGSILKTFTGDITHTCDKPIENICDYKANHHIYDDNDADDETSVGDTRLSTTITKSTCNFNDNYPQNGNYNSGEDIIWDDTAGNLIFDENINFTYEWFVKPLGDSEFKSCSDFLWCDNDYNDILTHGNTIPGDEWYCEITPVDWRGLGVKKDSSTIHVTGAVGEDLPEEGGGPRIEEISDNSDNETRINIGENVIINVTWSGPYDLVKLYICDNDTHIRNSGCWGYEFYRTTNATMDNPAQATFKADELAVYPGTSDPVFNITDHGPIEYKALLCSADYQCSNSSINDIYVNHIPKVTEVSLLHYNTSTGTYINGTIAKNSEILNCSEISTKDGDGDNINYTYRWWLFRSGYWQAHWEQGPTDDSNSLLSFSATEIGDQWKCEVIPHDADSTGISKDSSIVTISESDLTDGTVTINNITTLEESNLSNPTNIGNNITFIIDWTSPNTSYVTAYICNETGILPTGCRLGAKTFGFSSWIADNPIVLTYTVEEEDYGANSNKLVQYHTMVCNDNYECSDPFNKSYTNFGSNHIPEARNVTLRNEAGGTTIGENNSINCSYNFFDEDNSNNNSLGYATSNYYTEDENYFAWSKKIQGVWVEQISFQSQVIAYQYTSYGDQWKCSIKVSDGYINSTISESGYIIVGSSAPLIQSLEHNSNSSEPLTFGENLTFSIDWFDPQQEEGGLVQLFLCNSSSTTTGCSNLDTTYCEILFTDADPLFCTFNTSAFFNATGNGTNFSYHLAIYDGEDTSSSENGTMYINRKPTMDEVNITPDNPKKENNLKCNVDANDYDNKTGLTFNYTWYVDDGYGFSEYTYPNNETLASSHTSVGQRWRCEVKTYDNYTYSDPRSSENNVTITQYGVNSTPTILSFSANSNLTNPTNVGSQVTFTINWTDAEQPFGELVKVFVCNSSTFINEWGGCADESFIEPMDFTSENPIYTTYTILETDEGNIDFAVKVCDDSNLCSTTNTSNFSVNHIPKAQDVNVTNSTVGQFFNANENLDCDYNFDDEDSSNYYTENDSYFFWYKYDNGTYTQQNIETTVQNLSSDYTTEGESWKCGVIVSDGYINSTETVSTSIAIGNVDPVIDNTTTNSNSTNPLQYGDNVEFTIDWSDANVDELVNIFICNSTAHNPSGCLDTAFCELSTTGLSPFTCNYDTSNIDVNLTNISFNVYLYDSTDKETDSTGNFYINHLPTIGDVDLNTTEGSIWPIATDDLECNAINTTDQDKDNGMFYNEENATITGTNSENFDTTNNYTLNITYTNEGVVESCFINLTKSSSTNITTIITNVTSSCNLTATNSSGALTLTTIGVGSDEYITITGGNATSLLGFTENQIVNGTDISVVYNWYYNQGANFTSYDYNGKILTEWHTMIGDYWYCTVTPNDGYHNGIGISSNTVYIYDLSINDTAPTIVNVSVDSNLTNPTTVGNNITFTIDWNDADLPFGQTITAYICHSDHRWPDGSCKNPYTEIINVSSTPLIATYTTQETENSTSNFIIQLVDENGKESNNVSGYFAVNHPPNVTNVDLIQLTEDTLQCNFTYNPSTFILGRNDSEINDTQSDDNSIFRWYYYQDDEFIEFFTGTLNGRNITADFLGGEIIMCSVKVGDIWNLTSTAFVNSTNNVTVVPPPSSSTLWPLDIITNKNTTQIIGYLSEDNINNITINTWAWQGYETPKTNTTSTLTASTLYGTSTVIDTFQENSSFIVISNINKSEFSAGRFIEFSNHNRTYFKRYNITDNIEIIPDEQYRINIYPNLTTIVPSGTIVKAYNSTDPNGWFNITLDLFSGNNTIKAKAIKTITNGNLTGEFSSQQTTFSDSETPTIDTSEIPSFVSTSTPTINFNVSDNYDLNLSTLLLNISLGGSTIYHRIDNTVYNDTTWTFGQNISCSSINSTLKDCNVMVNLTNDGTYTLNFTINDIIGNTGSSIKSVTINTSTPSTPTVTRESEEFNNTNLTFNVSISRNITGSVLQYSIGTNTYPNDEWDSITTWINLTNFATGASNISYASISETSTNLTIYTGNLSLTPHDIYIANVRYQLNNWSLWSDTAASQSMKYFPPFTAGNPPSSVNVTAPLYSFSPILSIIWTESTDEEYEIDYYLITAGTEKYPTNGWNTTTVGWINAGNNLANTLNLTGNLTHLETYYFSISAVNTIGVLGTTTSSFGTTYYDQLPPVIEIISVSNDTDASDGWLDYVEDNQTLINITGDENMTCYYSLYNQNYADIDSSKGDSYCNTTGTNTDFNLTCNVTQTNGTFLYQGDYTYYLICQDTLSPTANQQDSSQNTEIIFTVDWTDEPTINNITIDITDYTEDSNDRNESNLEYALTDDLLFCNYVASDLDGNETIDTSLNKFIWYQNELEITSQTTAYLNLSGLISKNSNITCAVNVTDTTGLSSGFINNTDFTSLIFVNNSIPTQTTLLEPINDSFNVESILFNWTDSIDADADSINYTLYLKNVTALEYNTTITDSNYTLNITNTTDWSDGNYSWYITTCDNSTIGDQCTNSTNNLTFKIDQTPPTIDITAPVNNATVGILVEFYVDINDTLNDINTAWYTIINSTNDTIVNGLTGTPFILLNNSYYFAWSTSAFTTGNYTFFAHSNDTLGNYNNDSINFTLDLSEPYMEIDTDPWQFRNQWLKDKLFIRIFVNSTNSTENSNYTVDLNYTITHQNGTIIKTNSTTNNSASFEWNNTYYVNTSEWSDARYDAVFKVTDTLNNTETIETWFVIDKTPPTYANPITSPSPTYDDDNVTLSIDWLNNVFVWDANENNIEKESVKIIYTYNTSDGSSYKEINLSSGLIFINDTFSGTINSNFTNKSETIFWKSIADDFAGNRNDSTNESTNQSYWFNFTIYSTPPVFNQTIPDISWPEDTNFTNLTLNPLYFYDPDNDNLTYNYIMYPKGILLYDSLDNLTETINYNYGSYENVNIDEGITGTSISLESAILNLILNGGFENSTQDVEQITIPKEWTRYSHPDYQHNAPPTNSYVIVNKHNYYSQIIDITENTTYSLSLYMITNSSSGTGRLHINWFNELYPTDNTTNKTLSFLGSTLDCPDSQNCSGLISIDNTTDLNNSASRRTLTLTSPLTSVYAQIILDSDSNDTWVKIDKVQFEQKEYASAFYDGQKQPSSLTYPIATAYTNYSRNNFNKEQGTIEMFVKPLWTGNDNLNEDATLFNIRQDSLVGQETIASLTSENAWPFVFTIEANATAAFLTGTDELSFEVNANNNIFKVGSSDTNYTVNLSESNLTRAIIIQNLIAIPSDLSIEGGTEVIWINLDSGVTHNINIVGPESVSSGDLAVNDTFEHTFTIEGDYNYSSINHPEVNGTITVFNKTENRTLINSDIINILNSKLTDITAIDSNGNLKLETTETGSSAKIKIFNGTANTLLGFTEDQESTGENATTDTRFFEATVDNQYFNLTFNATSYNITEITNLINYQMSGIASSGSSGELTLTSLNSGEGSIVLIGEGAANAILGFTNSQQSEGRDAIDDIFWLGRKDNNLEFAVIERNWTVTHDLSNWSNNEWMFIAATWQENGSISLTVNNETTTNTGPISFNAISGEDFNGLTIYFGSDSIKSRQSNAYIDELAIYDYPRSSTDLLNDYNQNTTISFTNNINTDINQTTSNTTFNQTTEWYGEQRIRFFVNDTFTKIVSNIINLKVLNVNDPPTSSTIPNQSWSINLDNDDALFMEDYFNDIDSEVLTYTVNHTNTSTSTNIIITPEIKAKELISSIWLTSDTTGNVSFNGTIVTITEADIGNITLYQDISEDRINTTYTFSVTHSATNTNASEINYSVIIKELNSTGDILKTTVYNLTGESTQLTKSYTTSTSDNLTTIRITLQQNTLINNATTNSTWSAPSFTLNGNWVSFSQPENFTGTEIIYFNISDGENYTLSNNVSLGVYLNTLFDSFLDKVNYSGMNHENGLIQIYQSELYNSNITGINTTENNATGIGNETEPFNTTINYILNLTYTTEGVEEACSITLSQSNTLYTDTIISNISQAGCNITATNSSGSLKLTTIGVGIDEYIIITGGNATNVLGLITGTVYNGTNLSKTNIKKSFLNYTNATNSNITDSSINLSTIINSTLNDCDVRNSTVENYNASNCIITDSYLDPINIIRKLIDSNITDDSRVYNTELTDSTVSNSTINISIITNSLINNSINLFNSTIINSTVLNSNISDVTLTSTYVNGSTIDPSNVTNSTITGSSTVLDSNVTDSTLNDSYVKDSWILRITLVNANVTNNILYAGLVYNLEENLIHNFSNNGTNSLGNLTNYPPQITNFNFSQPDSQYDPQLEADINDENFGGTLSDNITYTIDWGDNSSSNGNITNNEIDAGHEYASSGEYTATLTVTDSFGEITIESGTLILTSSAGSGENCSDGIQNQNECSVDNGGVCGGSCGGGGSGGTSYPPSQENETEPEPEQEPEQETEPEIEQPSEITVDATCSDKIKNQGEEKIDCGGPCGSCETCYDKVQNQGEEDIDCGGPCNSCTDKKQITLMGIPLDYMPYIIGAFIALVAIIGLLMRLKSKPPKRLEDITKPSPKLTPIKETIPPSKKEISISQTQEEKPITPIKPKKEKDEFERLKEYIKIRLNEGTDKEHIKQALIIKGWPEEVIDVALESSKEIETELNSVISYIKSSFNERYTLENIKTSLLDQGWSESIIDLLLFDCHKPHNNMEKLKGYVNYKIAQGKKPEDIKQILKSMGWKEEVIFSVL